MTDLSARDFATAAVEHVIELDATLDALRAENGRLRRERDRLIDGLIVETWRTPSRTLACVDDSGVFEHVWEWRYGATGDGEKTRAEAVAAVRRAAGLDPGEAACES